MTVADVLGRGLVAPAMSDRALDAETANLVARAQAGDVDAFGELVDRHAPAARKVAAAALAGPIDADDVVQDACITAWRRLGDLADPQAFRGWLMRIVWRKALDRRRSAGAWLRRALSARPDDDGLALASDPGPNPERQAMATELDRDITRAIRALPTKLRDPFLLATAQHHRYDDIATLLGVPVGTVKWRVFEARRILRVKLAARGHEVADA